MDEDTLIELKVVQKDGDGNPTHLTVPLTFTLADLAAWLQDNLDFGE